jgi:NAD(P)-dependent dehydrogenase (short-subunit alcohol dehydrogenase family)
LSKSPSPADSGATPDKTWLITGASRGIGRELTEQLLRRGDRVAATARRPEQLSALTAEYGAQLWTAALDVTDTVVLRQVVDRAFAELGRVDCVISNAGYHVLGAAEEATDEELAEQLETNMVGPMQLTRAVLPHMRAQGGGRFIQISSMAGQGAGPGVSLYCASKWGVEGFLEAVRSEAAPFGIGITIIEPGQVPTDFSTSSVVFSAESDVYADGPVGRLRAYLQSVGLKNADASSDLSKVAAAIIDAAETSPAPLRVALGSDSYTNITNVLTERLAAFHDQRDLAYSVEAGSRIQEAQS